MAKKVVQTKVFQWQSRWWYWNKQGVRTGPFDTSDIASAQCSMHMKRIKFRFRYEKAGT